MLRINQTQDLDMEMDTTTAMEDSKATQASMLYHMLPTMVSTRLPTLPSLRKSLSDARNRASHSKSSSITEVSEPETPPPSYSSRPGSGSATPNRLSLAFTEREFDFSDNVSERSSSSGIAPIPTLVAHEANTGIKWKYASQGRSLITQAHHESSALPQDVDGMSASLTRQLYVHGITYLLRGLPSELTPEETLSLHAALPAALTDTHSMAEEHALIPTSQRTTVADSTPQQDVTILHRITATIVFQTFVLLQFLLPYIRLFVASAYQFERKYQITNRVVNTGVMTVDEISRGGLRLSQTVCQMNDGKVGQMLNEMALWWIRGVTGGIQQGIEELSAAKTGNEGSRNRMSVARGN
ncbi:hypothetical protein NX059_008109 [Plenodomus lindquistii]|nr:hypothetical protein NX059_008109 [Plenodomus lindquistii]